MRSKRTKEFRARLSDLPPDVQERAREAYRLFQANPFHPGLHFRQIDPGDPTLYSARVGLHYRVLGVREGDLITWFWIGSHAEYDRLV